MKTRKPVDKPIAKAPGKPKRRPRLYIPKWIREQRRREELEARRRNKAGEYMIIENGMVIAMVRDLGKAMDIYHERGKRGVLSGILLGYADQVGFHNSLSAPPEISAVRKRRAPPPKRASKAVAAGT